ncbi:MAG: hypothetical protein DRP85_07550 [Candidatus Makaraimicrobium thalassicum]|nr:MAG: hypothetical protein DRP85_07550 [Candidatus Omnitrophota bacterium]
MVRIHRLSYFLAVPFFLISLSFSPPDVSAETSKIFKTSYCDICYSDDKALSDFFWRISGKRFSFTEDISLARSRVDRLIDRVQSILDMYPDNLHVKIDLFPEYKKGLIAKYKYRVNTVTVYADKVTDGILAHEFAHAVICNYFDTPPPAKMQEILARYVDKYLWSDY